jgi:uncharacterized protein with HEPN domain
MSKRDFRIALQQMRDHAPEACQLARKATRSDLDSNRTLSLALVRLLEIVGEAANRVPIVIRERHPHVPWSQIIGLRNRLIHAYDNFDQDIIWEIVTHDLSELIRDLDDILKTTEENSTSTS